MNGMRITERHFGWLAVGLSITLLASACADTAQTAHRGRLACDITVAQRSVGIEDLQGSVRSRHGIDVRIWLFEGRGPAYLLRLTESEGSVEPEAWQLEYRLYERREAAEAGETLLWCPEYGQFVGVRSMALGMPRSEWAEVLDEARQLARQQRSWTSGVEVDDNLVAVECRERGEYRYADAATLSTEAGARRLAALRMTSLSRLGLPARPGQR